MFGRQITLFRIFGFRVGIDWSWLILAILITWTLAAGFFPHLVPDLSTATYWWMAVLGALGLFFSIIFHELSHSLVARRYDMQIRGITLFVFGGVAEMEGEPVSQKAEFLMAIAGPIASLLLATAFFLVGMTGDALGWPVAVVGVLTYLFWINGILALFNLVPAFPLDGWRMLCAVLWGLKSDFRWATRIASGTGGFFGFMLMILGVISFVTGNFIGGLWWFLLGLFVRFAATASYRQVVMKQSFEGIPVTAVMKRDPVTVSPNLTVAELVEDYFYRHAYKMFPVVDDGRLLGSVGLGEVQGLAREQWATTRIRDILSPRSEVTTVAPETDAMAALARMQMAALARMQMAALARMQMAALARMQMAALARMQKTGNGRLCVASGDRLAGILTRKDMLEFLSLHLDLEGDAQAAGNLPFLGRR